MICAQDKAVVKALTATSAVTSRARFWHTRATFDARRTFNDATPDNRTDAMHSLDRLAAARAQD